LALDIQGLASKGKGKIMRLFILIILTAALGWSAYWFFGKTSRETALTDWFDERSEAGWVAESTLSLRGFPNRYDAIIEGIELADPMTGWAWSAPRFELLQLSYQPNHFIALWPEKQQIKTPDQKIMIDSTEMRASVIFEPDSELELNRATLSAQDIALNSTQAWGATTKDMVLALRKSPGGDNTYDLGLDAKDFIPSNKVMRHLDRAGVMPATFKTFRLDASTQFNAPLSQASFETGAASLQNLTVNDAHLEWGDLMLRATGDIDLDSEGYPEGKLTIRATNWEQMLDLAIESGAVKPEMGATARSALKLLSAFSGNQQELDIPLRFSDRSVLLGVLPIGDAPRLLFP
jgi:hypothetical protein